jgi:hypothetical protein
VGKINWGGVVLGGLVAGVVLNVIDYAVYGVWLQPDLAAAMQALGKPPVGGSAIAMFVVLDFLYGVGLVWLYAAIRPRFGAGPKTAVLAGLALWVFIGLLQALQQAPMGFMPQRIALIGVIVALIDLPLAGAVGAYFYKEI